MIVYHSRIFIFLLFIFLNFGCQPKTASTKKLRLKAGIWRAVLQSPGGELPFGMEILANADSATYTVFVLNGEERLRLDTAVVAGDSVRFSMAIFDAEIKAHLSDSVLTGQYIKTGYQTRREMGFRATFGEQFRFVKKAPVTQANVTGKWAVTFVGEEQDTTQAVGIFRQNDAEVSGTFLTPTGDYRYLAGNLHGDTLLLSCFDGNHAFLFKARLNNTGQGLTQGEFWSGSKGHETWTATRNERAALPDATSLTFLKPGYDRLDFSFPDSDGKSVSIGDEQFKGKVVIVQILGSWCPNCMDETNFLSPWYRKNRDREVEIIGLAYEKDPAFAVSAPKLKRLINRFDINYPLLLAGVNDKEKASLTLPMLNRVMAFPTTLFIDKSGKVRQIHTGFSGPGTGMYYTEFVEDFESLVDKLLNEPGSL
jgi:thiol-disulfide isomerase/thioredoxin